MTNLILAALVFLGIHFFISGTRLRDGLVGAIGEGPYMGLFALASIASLVWLAMAYNAASASAENMVLYDLGRGVHDSAILIVGIAFLFGMQGNFAKNPTRVRAGASAATVEPEGVVRITRHPFLWGVALWAAFHTAANGDKASVIFFGTFLILALFGTVSIDAKRKRKLGPAWEVFAAKTSNLPFGAIAAGRNRFDFGETFGWRFFAALGIFLVFLFAHAWLFSASPFPNGWVPF
jgi:uncharacterized membrane protein